MGLRRRFRRMWLLTLFAGGLSACAPLAPSDELVRLLSPLEAGPYMATLIYARASEQSHPLAVVLDPKGEGTLSLLPLSDLVFRTESLGELERDRLVRRIADIPGEEFGGVPLQFAPEFEMWSLRPVIRRGPTLGYLMTVDSHLRYELRPGVTGQVFSMILRPSRGFVDEVRP